MLIDVEGRVIETCFSLLPFITVTYRLSVSFCWMDGLAWMERDMEELFSDFLLRGVVLCVVLVGI